jgi:DNA-binding helix-hairpin-helix protein with protein kinase domain
VTPHRLKTSSGQILLAGAKLKTGGEAAIHEIENVDHLLAKVYLKAQTPEKIAKLDAMLAHQGSDIRSISAWPIETIFNEEGRLSGFLMQKIADARDIHQLYSPKSRKAYFPKADWAFLVHASQNLAKAFAVAHANHCVIGDVNQGSILVTAKATMTLVDCDSFQYCGGGRTFRCEHGVDIFTPPELQGKAFATIDRTPVHDSFGLAILIFHLLFMGRHPFAGRYSGIGEMPIDKAISEGRFAYSAHALGLKMAPPPHMPPLSILGTDVANLFESAFILGKKRPTPIEWISSLSALTRKLIKCSAGHAHLSGIRCPWCELEAATGVEFFIRTVVITAHTVQFSGKDFWLQVEAAAHLSSPVNIGIPTPVPSAAALEAANYRRPKDYSWPLAVAAFLCGAAATNSTSSGFVVGLVVLIAAKSFASSAESRRIEDIKTSIRKCFADTETIWTNMNDEYVRLCRSNPCDPVKAKLKALLNKYDDLDNLRPQMIKAMQKGQREKALIAHLDRFALRDATIPNIGDARKATLASYNIETAADITETRLTAVPGIGPVYASNLLRWRAQQESRFRYDESQPLPAATIASIDADLNAMRQNLIKDMRNGLAALTQVRNRAEEERLTQRNIAQAGADAYGQAKANLDAISSPP